jgi:hypothetical protein
MPDPSVTFAGAPVRRPQRADAWRTDIGLDGVRPRG